MKVFQTLRRQYAILGISSPNPSPQQCPFNERVFFGVFLFGCFIGSQFMYIAYVASSFMDDMQCICSLSGTIIIFVCFLAIVFRKTTLFESIENIEKLIETSKTRFYVNENHLSTMSFYSSKLKQFVYILQDTNIQNQEDSV